MANWHPELLGALGASQQSQSWNQIYQQQYRQALQQQWVYSSGTASANTVYIHSFPEPAQEKAKTTKAKHSALAWLDGRVDEICQIGHTALA